jgi:hypothetical protein
MCSGYQPCRIAERWINQRLGRAEMALETSAYSALSYLTQLTARKHFIQFICREILKFVYVYMPHLENSFVLQWNLNTSESRSEIQVAWTFWNVLGREGKDQLDRSCLKWRSITQSPEGKEYPTYKKKEGGKERINWTDPVWNEEVLHRVQKERNILRTKKRKEG